ncbi:hypothetical protein HYV82_02475 [Candidatus Woesearchaeota archaeon]|nr:hypothetical protein [Candidatus Woesearchaeota archaeon]
MIPRCEGCKYEFEEAVKIQDKGGLFLATSPDYHGLGERRHFFLRMVNKNGRVIVG